MSKQIIFNDAVREKLRAGISKLTQAVATTLGPSGRVVLCAREYSDPYFTKDGVTVAKEIELEDLMENMGAQIVRQATSKTASSAGDGTTTATIYVQAIYEAGLKSIANGAKPKEIKTGIEMATNVVVNELQKYAKPIVDAEQLIQVGICSANQDKEIGTIVAEAIEKVGRDGVVTIEEGRTLETTTEIVDGLQFTRGYLSANFATNKDTQRAEYEKPLIFVTDQKLSGVKTILPLLEKIVKAGLQDRGLIVIADDVEGEALGILALNHVRGSFKACAIKAPDFGDRRTAQLEDIAIVTGATLVSSETGLTVDKVDPNKHLGTCERITIDRDTTTIVKGAGKREDVEARITLVKNQLENLANDFDKEKTQERLAKLVGGVARITVGGATEAEVREKKDRIDDALHACKAAVAEGILPGGGVSALFAGRALKALKKGLTEDQKLGVGIIEKALEAPLRWIARNTGEDDGAILARIRSANKPDFGYNAVTGEFGDMVKFGVIVPAKVERVALQNAASVASLLLTTDCMIAPTPEPKSQEPNGLAGMM